MKIVPPPHISLLLFACAFSSVSWPSKAETSAVRFSQAHGLYDHPFKLTLATDDEAEIHYTLDGGGVGSRSVRTFDRPISVDTTMVVRAWRTSASEAAPKIFTRTFLFPKDFLKQSGADLPRTWGEKEGRAVPAFYSMCDQVLEELSGPSEFERAFHALPAIALSLDPADLFGTAGIYAHPEEKGRPWERSASVELFFPDGRDGFARDCSVRIHGGWSRRPEESPKHGFRLVFRKSDDGGKLDFPLFGERGGHEFSTLILRGGNNNTFLHPSADERRRAEFFRDQWMRDTHAAMGWPAARGFFVHLYLNGVYWGVYNLTERPDASFAAASWGGTDEDYDARRADKIVGGDEDTWNELMAAVEKDLAVPANYEAVQRRLDLTAFIDFMILNVYGANGDWDGSSNWCAARDRRSGGRFQFLTWDAERTLEAIDANVMDYDALGSPPHLFQRLRANADFRLAFADRVQKHMLRPGGVLTPESAARRYRVGAELLDEAILGESARWGSYRRDVHPFKIGPYEFYTRGRNVRPEVRRLVYDYFPHRSEIVLRQFCDAGLYPTVEAPEVRVDGDRVFLTVSSARETFFTVDGSDPRSADGSATPSAKHYDGPIARMKRLKARSRENGVWSALAEAPTNPSGR